MIRLTHDFGPVAAGEGPLQRHQGGAQIFPLCLCRPLGEKPPGQPFKGGTHFEDLSRLAQIQRGHDRALVRQALHQALPTPDAAALRAPTSGTPRQFAELTLDETVAWTKLIVDYGAPQYFQDLLP